MSDANSKGYQIYQEETHYVMDTRGIATRGLVVRHLILPENIAGTPEVVRFIAEEISKNTYVNIMDQYRPSYKADKYLPRDRRITSKEFTEAVNLALEAGLTRLDGVII
jgi:putative pyruvate formate lyase activating enzyme